MSIKTISDFIRNRYSHYPLLIEYMDQIQNIITQPFIAYLIKTLSVTRNLLLFISVLPLFFLFLFIVFDRLGANAIEAFHAYTGTWTIRFLCITLFITPLQTITGWRGLTPIRQLFGLVTFFYAALHIYGYLWIDHGLVWSAVAIDIIETPYIWPGLFCFIILTLLALTSVKSAKKRMGKNWKKLHRWIYPASIAAVLHYFMQLKGNLAEPLLYALLVVLMLGFRALIWFKNRQLARLMIPIAPSADSD